MQDEESESTESHVIGDGCMQCKHFLFLSFANLSVHLHPISSVSFSDSIRPEEEIGLKESCRSGRSGRTRNAVNG